MSRWSRHIAVVVLCGFVELLNAQFLTRSVVPATPPPPNPTPIVNWVPVKVDGLWGYADTSGQIRIAPLFNAAESFIGSYAVVQKGNKAFVIDTAGTILTPAGHDQIAQLDDSVFAVYKNSGEFGEGGWGAEKIGGQEIVPMQYDNIARTSLTVYRCTQDSLMGFFNRNGTLIAPARYDTGWVFNSTFIALKRKRLIGVNTELGVKVLPDSCSRVKALNSTTVAGAKQKKWGAGKNNGARLIPFEYDSIGGFSIYFASAVRNDTVEVYATHTASRKVDGKYIHAVPFGATWAKAYTHSKKCAVIDSAGNIVVQPLYDDVQFAGNGTWAIVQNNKWGMIGKDGNVIIAPVYDNIQPFRNGMSIVFSGGLQGLINERGELLSKLANCSITIKGNTAKVVCPDNKVDYVKTDGQGNIIQRDEYEDVRIIKIGGDNSYRTKAGLPGAPQMGSSALAQSPRGDSLQWFYDFDVYLYGLRDAYLGDTLIQPTYSSVRKVGFGYTIVSVPKVSPGVILDGKQMKSGMVYGVFDDTTGKFVIEPQFTRLMPFSMHGDGSKTLFQCVRTDGMAGLISADGSERIVQASCIDKVNNGIAAFCVGGKWEMIEGGECRTNWAFFLKTYNIIDNGPFSNIFESENAAGRSVTHTGGKWGFMDAHGNVLVAPQYDAYEPSLSGTCIVKLGKKWGMIDTSGNTVVPFEFDMMRYLITKTDTLLQTQVNKVQMGCIDTLGNVVIPIANSKILALGENRIAVCNANRWEVARTNGEVLTHAQYLEIRPYSEGFAAVRIGRKWGLIDTSGTEVVAPMYDDIGQFSEGMCAVKLGLKWGYINGSGSTRIDHLYAVALPFFRGVAPVKLKSSYGLIDREGKTIAKHNYALIEHIPGSTVFSYRLEGQNGMMSPTGKVLTTARYHKFKDIGENLIAYQEGLYWGIMDTLGRKVSQAMYDKVGIFGDGLCPVSYQGQWGFIKPNGFYKVNPRYRAVSRFGSGLAFYLDLNDDNGFIDTTGKKQVSIHRCVGATPFVENKTAVRFMEKEKTWFHVYSRFGHRISREKYAAVHPYYHGAAPVKVGLYWGLLNFSGRYLIKPCFSQMSEFQDGVSIVQRNCTFGIYTLNGQQLLPAEYDVIKAEGAVIRLQRNNEIGYLHTDGRAFWPMQD